MRVGSLFSGAGGLDLAVEGFFGADLAWVVEQDPHASTVLEQRFGVPNLGDVSKVDWAAVEPVDVLCGGFPCQDVSWAGRGVGIEGARSGLWRYFVDAIRLLRPRVVVVENVTALLVRGFERVAADLASLGYRFGWGCVRASDAGAPHRRDRVFVVATDAERSGRGAGTGLRPDGSGWERRGRLGDDDRPVPLLPTPTSRDWKGANQRGDATCLPGAVTLPPTPIAGDAKGGRNATRPAEQGERNDGWTLTGVVYGGKMKLLPTPCAAEPGGSIERYRKWLADHDGRESTFVPLSMVTDWGEYEAAVARWEPIVGRPAPPPVDEKGRLNPVFVEWMMGWPHGWVTGVDVARTHHLRILGNGVVPQQAWVALHLLTETVGVAA